MTDETSRARLASLARLCRRSEVGTTLEALATLLCNSLQSAGVRWETREIQHYLVHAATGCEAHCTVGLLSTSPTRRGPGSAARLTIQLVFETQLTAEWRLKGRLVDAAGQSLGPSCDFWRYQPLQGEAWGLNLDHEVMEVAGLFDDWEQAGLLEAAEFVAAALRSTPLEMPPEEPAALLKR